LRFLRPIVLHGTKAGGTGRAGVRGGGVACHSVACAWRVCFGPVTSPTPATTNFPISLLTNPLRLAVGGLILQKDVGATGFGARFFYSRGSAAGAHTRDFVGHIATILKRSRWETTELATSFSEHIYLNLVSRQPGTLQWQR
jgi:hypothetical protein